jgi:spore coat protein CotF
MSEADRTAHHKKIKSYFLNPIWYKSELEAEQKKHAGKCVYHLSKTHTTENCHVKKECDKVFASRSTSSSTASASNNSTGQLRHLTEDVFEDACGDHIEDSIEDESNDANEESLNYFSRVQRIFSNELLQR